REPRRGFLSDDLQALHHTGHNDVLESGVQTLRVLTHHDEIEFRVTTRHVRQGAHRPQVRIQIQRLTQTDVDGSKTLANGRGDGTLQRHLVAHDGIEQLARQRLAVFFERL